MLGSLIAAACSSTSTTTPPRAVDDAKKPVVVTPTAPPGPYRVEANAPHGDVQFRVEWKDVPLEARASSGRTACATAKPPSIAPTTTWGVPDALVMIEVDHGKEPAPQPVRVVLDHCALSPRLAVGSELVLASAMDGPAELHVTSLGAARPLAMPAAPSN
ncbi:MAG TPA: hypothetical protein VGC41_14745, partial [Kofleriaceae bacterium]